MKSDIQKALRVVFCLPPTGRLVTLTPAVQLDPDFRRGGRASERERERQRLDHTPSFSVSLFSLKRSEILYWPFYFYLCSKTIRQFNVWRTPEWQRTLSTPPTDLRSADPAVKAQTAVGLFLVICGEISISWIFHLPTCCYVEERNPLLSPLPFIYCQNSYLLPTTLKHLSLQTKKAVRIKAEAVVSHTSRKCSSHRRWFKRPRWYLVVARQANSLWCDYFLPVW